MRGRFLVGRPCARMTNSICCEILVEVSSERSRSNNHSHQQRALSHNRRQHHNQRRGRKHIRTCGTHGNLALPVRPFAEQTVLRWESSSSRFPHCAAVDNDLINYRVRIFILAPFFPCAPGRAIPESSVRNQFDIQCSGVVN